jgi:hypothetical protein
MSEITVSLGKICSKTLFWRYILVDFRNELGLTWKSSNGENYGAHRMLLSIGSVLRLMQIVSISYTGG